MPSSVSRELGLIAVIVEGIHGRYHGDRMQDHREIAGLGRAKDWLIFLVTPERIEPGAGEVDANDLGVAVVALNLCRRIRGILWAGDNASEQSCRLRCPLIHEPGV